jgi:hypothetical protein
MSLNDLIEKSTKGHITKPKENKEDSRAYS